MESTEAVAVEFNVDAPAKDAEKFTKTSKAAAIHAYLAEKPPQR